MASREDIFCNIIANRAASDPDMRVLTIEGGGVREDETRTYGQLWEKGQRAARFLIVGGMKANDRLALVMANHAELVDLMVGAAIAGVTFVPVDARTRHEKLAFMLANAQCKAVIAADYALAQVMAARRGAPQLRWVAGFDTDEGERRVADFPGVIDFRDAQRGAAPAIAPRTVHPDAVMQILFTSGTTGDPKGIVCTHRRYCASVAAIPALFGYRADDRLYSGLSLTHANAQCVTLGAALHARLPCVLSRRFTKSRLWDVTRRYGCTSFTLLGGMIAAVYANPPRPDDADHPVRFVVSAGMPVAIWGAFEQRFKVRILEFYGAAEGGMTLRPIGVGPLGSIGRPAPGLQYRIVDEYGIDVAPGQQGELLFRPADGSACTVEYVNHPGASENKCRDGWLWMGDIVHADPDGWLYFDYRKGGGIRHNGEFINAGFVEKVVADCADVDDVYVWGVAAASGAPGEKDVVASVVPKQHGAFDAQAVFSRCRDQLEPNSVPSHVQVLAEIPKTASEKPQERFLLELFDRDKSTVFVELR